MTIKSKPTIKLSGNLQSLVSKELKLVSLAIDSNKSLTGLTEQLKKDQRNFQVISESWNVVQSKIRHPSLNISGLESMVKSLDALKSIAEMKELSHELAKNTNALRIITEITTLEKLVLASAYSSSSFAKSVGDILNSSRPATWKNTDMSLTVATNFGQYESITSVHVLDSRVINRLTASNSKSARRNVLLENKSGITKKCLLIAEQAPSDLAVYFQEAIRSFSKKDYASAQSLTANIIDSLVQKFSFSESINQNDAKSKIFLQESEVRSTLSLENFVVLHVLAGAYAFWKPKKGVPVPKQFNRNATAHHVHKSQYNLVNALEAMMLCAALLVAEASKELYA